MKPEYKGKVVMTDDALGHYLIWNQVTGADDPTQVTQEQLDKTTDLLIQIKTEQARSFSPNMGDMADIMARGEAWLSTIGWEASLLPGCRRKPTCATPTPLPAISPSSTPTASRPRRRISTPPTLSSTTCSARRRRPSPWTTWTAPRSTRRRSRSSTTPRVALPLRQSRRDLRGRAGLGLPAARGSGRRHRDVQRMARGMERVRAA